MPIYEYVCEKCGKVFEKLVASDSGKGIACEDCGSRRTQKKFSVFSAAVGKTERACTKHGQCPAADSGCCGGCGGFGE